VPPISIAFFATDDEQKAWLTSVGQAYEGWCVADNHADGTLEGSLHELTRMFSASSQPYRFLYLGRTDLSPTPVWLSEKIATPIDMAQSSAVRFCPSFVVDDIMVEGRLETLKAQDFPDRDKYQPVRKWINTLVKSLTKAWQVDSLRVALHSSIEGPLGAAGGRRVISPGAVDWYQRGGRLKQFSDGLTTFELSHED